jgi:hypothetical protein
LPKVKASPGVTRLFDDVPKLGPIAAKGSVANRRERRQLAQFRL